MTKPQLPNLQHVLDNNIKCVLKGADYSRFGEVCWLVKARYLAARCAADRDISLAVRPHETGYRLYLSHSNPQPPPPAVSHLSE